MLREDMTYGWGEASSYDLPNRPDIVLARARWLMDQLPHGPWKWGGRKDDVYLCTQRGGEVFLMGSKRSGMQGGQFWFQYFGPRILGPGAAVCVTQPIPPPFPPSVLIAGNEGPYVSRAKHDLKTIMDIDHPLAQLIKMLPELVAALEEKIVYT